jgi:spore germination cell wall hydrolase CwlJ-like protein
MSKKTNDAISRSDRVLVAAMAIIIATAGVVLGTSLSNHPAQAATAVAAPKAAVPEPRLVQAADIEKTAGDSAMAQLLVEHRCLSEVLYYEARGESAGGQKAVAEVVFHRMNHGNYGHSICAVVYEGRGRPGCQFSFACNGDMHKAKQVAAWRRSEALATEIMTGEMQLKNATGGATNFHAISVSPEWADTKEKTTQIGNHVFYRDVARTRAS